MNPLPMPAVGRVLRIGASMVIALLALVSAARAAEAPFAARLADRKAFDRFVEQGRRSPFGLDYVFVHSPGARNVDLVERVTGAVAVRWVNLAKLEWRNIERRPPENGRHTYNWSQLDAAVRTWQRCGVHIMVSMRFASPWATAPRTDKEFVYLKGLARQVALAGADYLPKPEHRKDLSDYVRSLVERYDGDGRDDMPGLLFPVLHYQVGNEYYNEVYWTGTAEEYGELLHDVAGAARAACADVKIILSGIGFRDVPGYYDLEMDPRTEAFVRENLPKVPAGMKPFLARSEAFSRTTAGFCDSYDILDARWPNYGIVARSLQLLREGGCAEKPVWSAEIYSGFLLMEPLVLSNWTLQAWPTPSRSLEYVKILKKPKDPKFEQVNAWYRGLHAAQVVKICMVALDAGSEKLMMGWAVDAQNPLAVSTLSHHGLYSMTFNHLWPAAYTYDLVIRKLDGLDRIERLRMQENVYVYRCTVRGGKQLLVAFYDDRIGQNHDEPTGETLARLPIPAPRARVTHIITEIGKTEPRAVDVPVEQGRLQVRLTEYPVFVEPLDGSSDR